MKKVLIVIFSRSIRPSVFTNNSVRTELWKKKLSSIVLLTLPEICLSLLLSHMFHLLGNVWTRQLCRNLKIEVNNTNLTGSRKNQSGHCLTLA